MKINDFDSNNFIMNELGSRIKKVRISQSKTQDDICKLSGISIATIKGVESGRGCSLDTLIKILKVLNLCSNLNDLIPDYEITPNDMTKIGKNRQRVYKKKYTNNIIWGEDKKTQSKKIWRDDK